MTKDEFKLQANRWRDWFQKGQKNWSFLYYSSVYGSIICSIAAGAFLQFKSFDYNLPAISSILTTIAAALTSLSAASGFQRKWRSNRLSRSRVDELLLDVEAEAPDIPDLTRQLKEIIARHDEEIVTEATTKKADAK